MSANADRVSVDRGRVFGQHEEGVYERIAPEYFPDSIVREHEARYRWAARYVAGKSVLDVGCGTGYGCSLLSHCGAKRVIGVDISFPALEYAKRCQIQGLVGANVIRLPFGSSTFDVVTCFEVIEHIADQSELLEEMKRVLRTGGVVVLSTPNRNRTSGNNPYHVKELLLSELLALTRKHGLRCIERSGQHWELRPKLLKWVYGIRRAIYGIENTARVFRAPEIIAEPSVFLVAARKEQ